MANLFFRNTRLLALSIALILVAGLSALHTLPRLEDPELTPRFAQVLTRLPGARAERVEALVTDKIEEELFEVEEIKVLESESRAETSLIIIELKDEVYAVDEVWSRVRDKIDDARPLLPEGTLESEFEEQEVRGYAMLVALTWDSPGEPNYAILRRRAEAVEDVLRSVPGTEDIDLFGDPEEEVTVKINAADLALRGLTAEQVSQTILNSDAKVSAGQLRGDQRDLLIEVDDQLDSLARIRSIPVQSDSDGRFVRLGDIATVEKGVRQPVSDLAIVAGKPAITVGAYVDGSKRIDVWATAAHEALDQYSSEVPGGVGLEVVFDQSQYTESRLTNLTSNLVLGGLAVVVVIWFMMGWRSAIVVGSALPLTSLMVLAGMKMMGIPMHQMSVTGLIIALGLLIDNAIVMVDEVRNRMKHHESRAEAIAHSVRHLAVPLLGSTITTALAFMPIALMPGPAGEFVGAIAISVILAIVSSLALSLTVIPAIAGLLEYVGSSASTTRLWSWAPRWMSEGFSSSALTRGYLRTLGYLYRRPVLAVALSITLPLGGFLAATQLTEQFFPPADRDMFHIQMTLPSQASLAESQRLVEQAREIALEHEDVTDVHWFLGESAPQFYYNLVMDREHQSNYAQAMVKMTSAEHWREVIHDLQAKLDVALPQARILVRQIEQGPPFTAPIELRIYGPDLRELRRLGDEAREILATVPDVIHTGAILAEADPKLGLHVDEEQARLVRLSNGQIASQLRTTLEGSVGGSILEATEELPVRVRVDNAGRGDLDHIATLDLLPPEAAEAGGMRGTAAVGRQRHLPLSAVADIQIVPELANVPRRGGRRVNTVQGYITAGVLPGEVLGHYRQELAEAGFSLPAGYSMEFGGETAERDNAIGNLLSSVGVLMVLMIATLVLTFGSFRMAGIIGGVGALSIGLGMGALWLFGWPFGFMAIVGTMGLAGIAINDAIVVLAAIRENPASRSGDPDAVRDVVGEATRHVMSTTVTTTAGFMPLLIDGGGFWPPLATAIAGGVSGATVLAIMFVPAMYLLAIRLRRTKDVQPTHEQPEEAVHETPALEVAATPSCPAHVPAQAASVSYA